MEITEMMLSTGWNIMESVFPEIRKKSLVKESGGINSFVMKAQAAEDYRIRIKYAKIEIRDGFNSNLVVQCYEKSNSVIIYIPEEWQRKISVELNGGVISCQQKEMYHGLQLSVEKGKIIYGEEANDEVGS